MSHGPLSSKAFHNSSSHQIFEQMVTLFIDPFSFLRMSSTARLFIAVPLPAESLKLSGFSSWRKFKRSLESKKQPQRWVAQNHLHFTLKFLGTTELAKIDLLDLALSPIFEETAPFELPISGAGAFPEETEARVVWLGVKKKKKLSELAQKIEEALEPHGFEEDPRDFSPHLTVLRFKSLCSVKSELGLIKNVDWLKLQVDHVCLYRSDLRGAFPHYTELKRWALKGAPPADISDS